MRAALMGAVQVETVEPVQVEAVEIVETVQEEIVEAVETVHKEIVEADINSTSRKLTRLNQA